MDPKKKILAVLLVFTLFLSLSSYLGYTSYKVWREAGRQRRLLEERRTVWTRLSAALESQVRSFRGEAGVVIEDLNTGWQFSLNRDTLIPSASIVKIPIMAACFQAASEGRLDLNQELVLDGSDKTPGSGILKSAASGTTISVAKLIEIMITRSDNTAANMLINRLGFDYLNDYFKRSGLKRTNLARKMMDFQDRKNGVENYTSASDISGLLQKIYRGRLINRQVSQKCLAMLLRQKVNDRIPRKLPEDCSVAHKTGLEKNVCHDAGIVFTRQGDFLICVLTKSSSGARPVKEFISDLALNIYRAYCQFPRQQYSSFRPSGRKYFF